MTDVEAKVIVTKATAEALPSNPEWVRRCMAEAEQSMNELAGERHRHISAPPKYVDARDTRLGYVGLIFTAPTAAD